MGSLVGKKVFITGAEQGIGKETARKLIEAGCDIYIHYFSGEEGPRELMAIAEQKGGRAACGYADLTNEEDAARCVAQGAAFLGGIDILVNNVGGIIARKWLGEIEPQFWRTVIDVNMTTMLNVTQQALPWLKAIARWGEHCESGVISRSFRRPCWLSGLFHHERRRLDLDALTCRRTGRIWHSGERRGPRIDSGHPFS